MRTSSFSTPSTIDLIIFSTTDLWFPCGLSSRNRIMRHRSWAVSQYTSTIRSSICSPLTFSLFSSYKLNHFRNKTNKLPFPFFVIDIQFIKGFIRVPPTATYKCIQEKLGFWEKIRFCLSICVSRESQDQLEVDRVFIWRFPFQAII